MTKKFFLVAQKDANVDEPNADDIYKFGTVATILQLLKLPDGTVKVLVEELREQKFHISLKTKIFLKLISTD